MRKIGISIGLLLSLTSCDLNNVKEFSNQQIRSAVKGAEKNEVKPVLKEFDFGRINVGDSIEHVFQLMNTGSSPVVIEDVKASCGCTTVDWMKTPISPGGTGWIKSRLTATDKGRLRKSVVAQVNTKDAFVVFYLTGEVTSADSTPNK